jgi:hypothetical protein
MNYWLKEQSDMYITNLQSVMVQKQNGKYVQCLVLIRKSYIYDLISEDCIEPHLKLKFQCWLNYIRFKELHDVG